MRRTRPKRLLSNSNSPCFAWCHCCNSLIIGEVVVTSQLFCHTALAWVTWAALLSPGPQRHLPKAVRASVFVEDFDVQQVGQQVWEVRIPEASPDLRFWPIFHQRYHERGSNAATACHPNRLRRQVQRGSANARNVVMDLGHVGTETLLIPLCA
jgi:hypothetical protein